MSRSLSATALASANAQETGEVWLICLSIYHADVVSAEYPDGTIRLVADYADLTRTISGSSKTFIACPFEVVLPGEQPDQAVSAVLRVDNVDRAIVEAVREISGAPKVSIEVVLASSPNTVEVGFYDLTLREVTFDALYVEGALTIEEIFVEPITVAMTPQRFPGMF